ncbi:MAG: DUF2937 family protein, partial [Alphaproteobacteria bacterium]|nr:DUF2937 family protein [Alphaproteobacteria bacterium]
MRSLHELTAIALAIVLAVAASQLPRFVQEYEQRLGGALQEAQRTLDELRDQATALGLDFDAFVARLATNPDPAAAAMATAAHHVAERVAALQAEAATLAGASRLAKP